jgi:predicted Zn-dependent protease
MAFEKNVKMCHYGTMLKRRHSNVSWIVLALLAAALAIPRAGFAITIGEEDELSREMLRIIFKRFEVVQDPYIAGYVTRVGARILKVMPGSRFDTILRDQGCVVQCPSRPAGHIFVHTGLLEAMTQEEELVSILA